MLPPTWNKIQSNISKIKKGMMERWVEMMQKKKKKATRNSKCSSTCKISEYFTKLNIQLSTKEFRHYLDINFSELFVGSWSWVWDYEILGIIKILLIWHLNCLLFPYQYQIYWCVSTERGNSLLVFSAFFSCFFHSYCKE